MSSPSQNPLKRIIGEIHRRSLWQILGIYAAASWIVLQVIDTLEGVVTLPDWFAGLAVGLLVVGLPVVLATAFVQEGGPGHDREDRTPAVSASTEPRQDVPSRLLTWRNALVGCGAALLLMIGVALGWLVFGDGAEGASNVAEAPISMEQSVAVLPFVNMSGDPDNEYFSDGITEELLNALARLPGVRVPARTSSFAFKGQNIPIQQIADTLNVSHVVEGSVRRDGQTVLITAQLVDAESDSHVWSDTFERELDDIFAIQREIAAAVADQLQITLAGNQPEPVESNATPSTDAHDAYLQGRFLLNRGMGWAPRGTPLSTPRRSDIRAAIEQFQKASELDPDYAEAYSGLADSYMLLNVVTGEEDLDVRAMYDRGMTAAQHAVALAPELGMAHASLAFAHLKVAHWERAGQEFQRAIQLSPAHARMRSWHTRLLLCTDRPGEAVVEVQRAANLDPVRPPLFNLGIALHAAGRYEEAAEPLRQVVELGGTSRGGESSEGAVDYLWASLLELGQYDRARDAWMTQFTLPAANPVAAREAFDAVIRSHQTGEAESFSLPDDFPVSRTGRIMFYSLTGQRELALEAVGFAVRSLRYIVAAQMHWRYLSDLLGEDSRYQALLEGAGISW